MWKWVGVGVEGIIGVPARDLTDEEFAVYNAKVNAQHTADQRGALILSGLYEHVEEKPEKKSSSKKEEPVIETVTAADTTNTATVDKKDDKKDE